MERKDIPELNYLLARVEKKYSRHISTSTDFESLSVDIERVTNDVLSASTLKRIWGYVSMKPTPRCSTLDILSRYIGFHDFKAFCDELRSEDAFVSEFFTTKCFLSSDMSKGDRILIGWHPNREVVLEYIGENEWEVVKTTNSKLLIGDRFQATEFMLGTPLWTARILRGGEYTPPFIAGRNGGLTRLEKVFPE